ncbi:MAG: amidohydrolase family protein [bacterium]
MSSEPITDGALVVNDDRIIAIGDKLDLKKQFTDAVEIDLGDRIIMPALVNAHTHIALSDASCVNTGNHFPQWLFDLMAYRTPLTDDDIRQSAINGLKELYRNGTTTIGDSNPDLIPIKAAALNNFRGVFFFEVFGIADTFQFLKIQKYKRELLKASRIASKKTRLGISPHTPYTVTHPVLKFASGYAKKNNMIVSMHVAESKDELEFLKSNKGLYRKTFAPFTRKKIPPTDLPPLNYVNSFNLLNSKFICAHGVHLTEDEFFLLAGHGGSLVSCPSSNHNLGAGHLDIQKPLDCGVNLCIGTDSPASSDGYDLFHELRLALKINTEEQITIKPYDALKLITVNPAKALGFETEIGALENGKSADIIALNPPRNFDFQTDDIYSSIVSSSNSDDIALTISSGKICHSKIDALAIESHID